jgi:predicted transcriptional regulator
MSACGECSMCCKLIEIADPILTKAANTWCKFCSKPGCRVYGDRPESCQKYACLWLQHSEELNPLPLNLRPDKSKVVIDITEDNAFAILRVDPVTPKAMNTPEMKAVIRGLAQHHSVICITGRRREILHVTPKGQEFLKKLDIKETVWYE